MELSLDLLKQFDAVSLGRYIHNDHVIPLLESLGNDFTISEIGTSVLGKPIFLVRYGFGENVVFGWSQMHGNEGTTTRALFNFFDLLDKKSHPEVDYKQLKKEYSLFFIPILNPDGAEAYTRENANGIDLNRDAADLTQEESKILKEQIAKLKPSLCLNLHDQRSIYGLDNGNPAVMSFLSPAADAARKLTSSRKTAMQLIVKVAYELEKLLPGHIGRYDDTFNHNCIGDQCSMQGIPTILFEAGHFGDDYQRDISASMVLYAFLVLFDLIPSEGTWSIDDYESIPQNNTTYNDVLLSDAKIDGREGAVDIAIQYREELQEGQLQFIPYLDGYYKPGTKNGHHLIELKDRYILVNSQEIRDIGEKIIRIVDHLDENNVFYPEK